MTMLRQNGRWLVSNALVVLATLGIMAVLVLVMIHHTRPVDVNAERVALRTKNLAELRAADAAGLSQYGWVDQAKGVVRLPLERALELTVREWQDPATARSNLLARAEALAAQPPAAPAAPSPYE